MESDEPPLGFQRSWHGLYVPRDYTATPEPTLRPLGPDDFATMLHGLNVFAEIPDVRCVWEFNESEGGLLGLTLEPGCNLIPDTDYTIVCSFRPGKLIIHSPVALRAGAFQFGISHAVLFDSNMYNRILKFVESPDELDPRSRDATTRLLRFIITRKYDYQMMPYVLESFAVNSVAQGWEYAHRVTRAILTLHTMQRDRFVTDGTIVLDPDSLTHYDEDFGTTNFDDIASAQLEPYRASAHTPNEVKLALIALIWMVLCKHGKVAASTFAGRFAAFDEFMFARTGLFVGFLRNIAIFYFSGALDKWIRVQRNSRADKALEDLTNSAWDLYLGDLPNRILASSPEERPVIAHFCTCERELAELLSISQTVALRVRHGGGFAAFRSTDTDLLFNVIGPNAESTLRQADSRTRAFLKQRDAGTATVLDDAEIDRLLDELTSMFRAQIGT